MGLTTAVPLELNGLGAGEIKRHPGVETLLGQPWTTVVRWSGESRPSEQGKLKFVTLGR